MSAATSEPAVTRSECRVSLEKQLAGSLLAFSGGAGRKPYLAADILAICPARCFIGHEARAVMEAASAIVARGEVVDLVSVAVELHRAAGGKGMAVHQATLASWAVNAGNLFTERAAHEAAATISAEWRKDEAAADVERALQSLRNFGEPLDLPLHNMRAAQETLDSGLGGEKVSLDARLDEYVEALTSARTSRPVQTPWASLTRILRGGTLPKELIVLAARPSVGKSAFALNWALSVARAGKAVVFFSLEMGREQMLDRLIANTGNIDLGAFRLGLTEEQRQKALYASESMRGLPLDIIDDAHVTIGEIRRRVRIAQRRKTPLGLVVVDYLQLLTPEDRRLSREQQVATMSRELKLLAKSLDVPVLLLAQLNRKGEEANREPIMSDLRESGAIEQDADIIIFLHQARRQTWHPDEPVKFLVAKGRSSGVGRDTLIFRRRLQRFEESSDVAFAQAEKEEERELYGRQYGEQTRLV